MARMEVSAGPGAGDYANTWRPLRDAHGDTFSAVYTCPNRHSASLEDAKIWTDGLVEGQVKCPDCDFKDQVVLLAWRQKAPLLPAQRRP